jgi:hypothetical protein
LFVKEVPGEKLGKNREEATGIWKTYLKTWTH